MKRRSAIALIVVVALVLAAALAMRWALRPQTLGPRVLDMASQALGLEISADRFEYRLWRSPQLVVTGASARVPGAPGPMIDAERVMVALPWSTLRRRGADPTVTRIELDAPRVRLDPFLQWWSGRPRGDGPLPTLREGLRVDRGRIEGNGWALLDIAIDLPHFAPDARLQGRVRGRYQAATLQAPFDLQVAMTRPGAGAGLGIAGTATPRTDGWRVPSRLTLSARVPRDMDSGLRLHGLRLSSASRYVAVDTAQPFAFGIAGEAALTDGRLRLQPAALDLRGRDMIPNLQARGRAGLGQPLELELTGHIERWPDAWPTLPPPIGDSGAPLPFALDYRGAADFSDPLELELTRDQARFNGRIRIDRLAAWIGAGTADSPLPPLEGRVTAPLLDIGGATLHGVEISVEDDAIPADGQP